MMEDPKDAFRRHLNPAPQYRQEDITQSTKYLIPLFQGGKQAGSQVRFAKFFLVIDPLYALPESINACLLKFQTSLRKQLLAVKGGEAAFKPDGDGPCFNAFASINETFKQIEDALNAACQVLTPNPSAPVSVPQTADSQSQKLAQDILAKPIRLGVNCDADFLFNKDPKDPNKYDVEGAKGQQTSAQLQEYYLKMITDHPLVTYIEDAFAEADTEGMRQFKRTLARKAPQVQMGCFFKSFELMQQMV